jgi:heterodisulfide reductase subunit D
MTTVSRISAEHFTVRQLLELEGCTRCGECIAWCPTYTERLNEQITPLSKISHFRSFLKGQYGGFLARLFGHHPPTDQEIAAFGQGTFQCTLCGRCHVVCPIQIRTRPLWIAIREQLVDWQKYPPFFDQLRDSVTAQHNISGEDNAQRLIWSENLETKPPTLAGKPRAETVYFAGCVSSFYPTVYGIPQTFVSILSRAGLDFTTMGGDEWCCGYPLIIAGMGKHTADLIRHNVEAVQRTGAKRMVTTCPSCYHTWRNEYPEVLHEPLGFEVVHSTELLADLLSAQTIPLNTYERPVTYHDPCDLGRNSGIYDAPRRVLQAIPGLQLKEMKDIRERSLCCGGGGDAEMADAELTGAVAHRRLEQVRETEAQVLVSACQQCKRTLAGQARKEKLRIKILDITELVWEVMQQE